MVAQQRGSSADRVVFRWTFPAKGHTGAWTFTKGIMTLAGETPGYAFPPIALKNAKNFAVEATMRGLGPGGTTANLAGFGIVVGHNPANPHSSISGGSFFSAQPEDTNPELYWNGDTVGGAALDPGTAWHTYRLEVRGNLYTLKIDGKQMVQYPIDDYRSPPRVGVFSLYYRVQIKAFRVLGLTAAGGRVTHAPALKSLELALPDLPTNDYFQPLLRHYTTNVEAAREQNVSLASLQAQGRISAYIVSWYPWGTDFFDLYSGVTDFTTAAGAQASNAARLDVFKQQFSSFPNFQVLPDEHVGDTNEGIRLDIVSQGQTVNAYGFLFTRGTYAVLVRAVFVGGVLSESEEIAKLVGLAKIVDSRVMSH